MGNLFHLPRTMPRSLENYPSVRRWHGWPDDKLSLRLSRSASTTKMVSLALGPSYLGKNPRMGTSIFPLLSGAATPAPWRSTLEGLKTLSWAPLSSFLLTCSFLSLSRPSLWNLSSPLSLLSSPFLEGQGSDNFPRRRLWPPDSSPFGLSPSPVV